MLELNCVASTDTAIAAVWDPARFATIDAYHTWEAALLEDEDIIGHIAAGGLVPISIGSDGAWRIIIRTATADARAELTDRERQYAFVASQPYLFVCTGIAIVSGYEHIKNDPGPDLPRLHVPPGRYSTAIHQLDWQAEPGALGDNDDPSPEALPDFVILLNPEPESKPIYRTKVESFDRPAT